MKAIILSFVFIGLGFTTYAQIGIGTTSPAATAALDIESTTKGLLIPRLTQTQRNAIQSPATGLMIFCTDLQHKDSLNFITELLGILC
jgi:hypothetical protein